MIHSSNLLLVLVLVVIGTNFCTSFSLRPPPEASKEGGLSCRTRSPSSALYSGWENNQDLQAVRGFLQQTYPSFYMILDTNDEVWKAIGDVGSNLDADQAQCGFTVFVPHDAAIQGLGERKQTQLMDGRNLETTQKIAGYHVIGEVVTPEQLYNAGGILTVSGDIPVERSVSGGMFGFGGQEDGGVTINKAKILRTFSIGSGLVYEVDNLVSPSILWRFMDQLRIPGSR
jgi:hypothetical protein